MDEIRVQVRRAAWRLGFQRFLGVLGYCLTASLALLLVLVVVDTSGRWASCPARGTRPPSWDLCPGRWGRRGVGPVDRRSGRAGVPGAAAWALAPAQAAGRRRAGDRPPLRPEGAGVHRVGPRRRRTAEPAGQAVLADAGVASGAWTWPPFHHPADVALVVALLPAAAMVLAVALLRPSRPTSPSHRPTSPSQEPIKKSSEELLRRLAEQRKQAKKEGLPDAERCQAPGTGDQGVQPRAEPQRGPRQASRSEAGTPAAAAAVGRRPAGPAATQPVQGPAQGRPTS